MFQDFIEILILSAIQGISEFLPISSSAHLIIVSSLYDLKASSLINRYKFTFRFFVSNNIFFLEKIYLTLNIIINY